MLSGLRPLVRPVLNTGVSSGPPKKVGPNEEDRITNRVDLQAKKDFKHGGGPIQAENGKGDGENRTTVMEGVNPNWNEDAAIDQK